MDSLPSCPRICLLSSQQLIDIIEGNRQYIPCLYVLNMIDNITIEELDILSKVPHYVPICAAKEWNFDGISPHHRMVACIARGLL